jgi:hypothetical protein
MHLLTDDAGEEVVIMSLIRGNIPAQFRSMSLAATLFSLENAAVKGKRDWIGT